MTQQSGLKDKLLSAARKAAAHLPRDLSFTLKRGVKFSLAWLRGVGLFPRFRDRKHFFYKLGMVTVFLSLISSFSTYFILSDMTPIRPTDQMVTFLLLTSIVFVLMMLFLVSWQITALWRAHRNGQAGARLHVRIVRLFGLIATVPAVLLAVFASIHIDGSLDQLFSKRIQSIIYQSVQVAKSYVEEHGQGLKSDVLAIAKELDSGAALAKSKPGQFRKLLNVQASLRSVSQAYLIDRKGKVLVSSINEKNTPYYPPVDKAFEVADKGGAVRLSLLKLNKIAALKKLKNFDDTYLYILRSISPAVVAHMQKARANVAKYNKLKAARTGVQVALGLMYVTIALSLLLSAVWLGLWFANRLVEPIRRLINASQQVSEGDLDVSVKVKESHGDVALLGNTFNKMTAELKSQRDELVTTNTALDERRRFIEAVLYSVTAGVIGVNAEGEITLVNHSARKLLNLRKLKMVGHKLSEVVPHFSDLLDEARRHPKGRTEGQINMIVGTAERNFAVRVTRESTREKVDDYVLTFDDITELVTAQRTSAWADVARRIAHEIKNPLTPIQLSAERIRRKYGKVIEDDRETFEKLTGTIVRHVGDIKKMVDEFSSFARMPKPVMEWNDVRDIIRDAVLLFQVSHSAIEFKTLLPKEPVRTLCDRRLLTQAVTNLVKNATEAVEAHVESPQGANDQGRIVVNLTHSGESYEISVVDNGIGLPQEHRNRLVEPYMTTREKGTGLGLAIVKKIVEQHHGQISLEDASASNCPLLEGDIERGACIRMVMPVQDETVNRQEEPDGAAMAEGGTPKEPGGSRDREAAE